MISKKAMDAMLEILNDNDPEYATHQHHSDPSFTTQTGKDYAGRGSTEDEGGVSVAIPAADLHVADLVQSDPKFLPPEGPEDATFFKEGEPDKENKELTEYQMVSASSKRAAYVVKKVSHGKIVDCAGDGSDCIGRSLSYTSTKTAHANVPDPGKGKYDFEHEAHVRDEIKDWAQYAEEADNTDEIKPFDPEGNYLCGTCDMRKGTKDCMRVESPINFETGSCRMFHLGDPETAPPMKSKFTKAEAKYSEHKGGFSCKRCEYGAEAAEPDPDGRPSWCSFWGTHVIPDACCSEWDEDEEKDKKEKLVQIEPKESSAKCAACEEGGCMQHESSIKSYGMDTPIGGTPNQPSPEEVEDEDEDEKKTASAPDENRYDKLKSQWVAFCNRLKNVKTPEAMKSAIPMVRKYADKLRELGSDDIMLFDNISPSFKNVTNNLDTAMKELDEVELKLDDPYEANNHFRDIKWYFDAAVAGVGIGYHNLGVEYFYLNKKDAGLNITASFELVAADYKQMFQQLLAMFPNLDSNVNGEIAWAKSVLKKQDRIVWYLRWVRLVLERKNATGRLRKIKALLNQDIAAYSKKNPITVDDIPQSMDGVKRSLEHTMSLTDKPIHDKIFAYETPNQLEDEFKKIEQSIAEKQESERRVVTQNPDDEDEIFMSFPDGWKWFWLKRASCSAEAKAMGHCGNSPRATSDDTILSLRQPVKKAGKTYWSPHLTFILDDNSVIGEMKGRNNQKPTSRYHPYIIALLKDNRIKGIKGGGYMPSHNFKMSDLTDAQKQEIRTANPNIGAALDEHSPENIERLIASMGLNEDSFEPQKDLFVVRKWSSVRSMVDSIGNGEADAAIEYALEEANGVPVSISIPDVDDIANELATHLSAYAMDAIGKQLEEEDDWLLTDFKRTEGNIDYTNKSDFYRFMLYVGQRAPESKTWKTIEDAYRKGREATYRSRRIGDLEYFMTQDIYEYGGDNTIYTEFRYGPEFSEELTWKAKPAWEVITWENAIRLMEDDETDHDISNGQLEIYLYEDNYEGEDEDNEESYDLVDKWYTEGLPKEEDERQMKLNLRSSLFKKGFIDREQSPEFMPPQDRRHIDDRIQDEIKDEVMEGVHQPSKKPPKPDQIDPNIMINASFNRKESVLIRKLSGSKLEETLNKAIKILGENGIPTLVIGGYAVQEYGYPRYTKDVDIVVPSIVKAVRMLTVNGFHSSNTPGIVLDNDTNEEVDLLLAGQRMNNSKVPFPIPSEVVIVPKLVTLQELIDLKLGSYASAIFQRAKDLADVIELIKRNGLSKDLMVSREMEKLYRQLWDGLQSEKEGKLPDSKLSSILPIDPNKIADKPDKIFLPKDMSDNWKLYVYGPDGTFHDQYFCKNKMEGVKRAAELFGFLTREEENQLLNVGHLNLYDNKQPLAILKLTAYPKPPKAESIDRPFPVEEEEKGGNIDVYGSKQAKGRNIAEAVQAFMKEKYMLQQAQDMGISMDELWKMVGNEYAEEYFSGLEDRKSQELDVWDDR